jgi:hypothetical protein
MINLFYILSFLFIWMNLYYLANLSKLDVRFYTRDITKMDGTHLLYYNSRVFYWFWIAFGILTPFGNFFWTLIILGFIKFLVYHVNKSWYAIYRVILPILSLGVIGSLLVYWFIKG